MAYITQYKNLSNYSFASLVLNHTQTGWWTRSKVNYSMVTLVLPISRLYRSLEWYKWSITPPPRVHSAVTKRVQCSVGYSTDRPRPLNVW